MKLTPRDLDLLETLTCRVSILRVSHVARIGWGADEKSPRKRLQQLARAGWISLQVVNAHPPFPAMTPLFVWKPGKKEPDPERLSRQARERWSKAARPTAICLATRESASLFGSTAGRLHTLEQLDHDLLLAAVYVHYRRHHPRLATLWIGEHVLPKAGYRIKDPDAFLREKNGHIRRVIESAGRYSPDRIESFHEHCADRGLPYELW